MVEDALAHTSAVQAQHQCLTGGAEFATQTQTELPESSSSHRLKEELVCGICMEDVHQAVMHSIGGCMHQFCKGCLERHIQTQLRCKPLPVRCPAVGCHQGIDGDECTVLLRSPEDINRLTQVQAIIMQALCNSRMMSFRNDVMQEQCTSRMLWCQGTCCHCTCRAFCKSLYPEWTSLLHKPIRKPKVYTFLPT